jgi:hypothetical protein
MSVKLQIVIVRELALSVKMVVYNLLKPNRCTDLHTFDFF